MKILLIEDEIGVCESIERTLKRVGFSVIVEMKGRKALKLIKKEKPNIVLLDLVLEDIDGFDVLKQIKEHDSNLPVIVATALKEDENRKKAINLGADDYLTKPFKAEDLRKIIKQKIESVLVKKNRMEKPNILLVEDSDDYRKQISNFINKRYQVNLSEAKDGTLAIEEIKMNKHDLVILDIKMPGQDGLEVLKEIKDVIALSSVIILSGWSDKQVMLKAFNLGIFAYISKSEPDIYELLQEKIESILISKGKLLKSAS